MVRPRSQHGSQSVLSSSFSGVTKPSGQKAACSRCRGQKLRCVWDSGESQCQRCQKADALCAMPSPKPMGRPPRQHHHKPRDPSRDHSSARGDTGNTIPAVSSDVEDGMDANTVDALPDPLDFLNFGFPDISSFDAFLPPEGPRISDSNLSNTGAYMVNGGSLSSSSDLTTNTAIDGVGDTQVDTTHLELEDDDGNIKLLTRLCELNVALFKHPLNANKGTTLPHSIPTPDSTTHGPTQRHADSRRSMPRDVSVSDLGIGKLLQMTYQLRDVISCIQYSEARDRSTALLILSCYTRLGKLYSRTLEILRQVRGSDQQLKDAHELMPGLAIDGFQLGKCYDLQLSFVIYLFEQVDDRLSNCIKRGTQEIR
ncbi:hypothetical protein K431DRAFT_72804 [Polychaeton citri CBS 116435]|uniref:Zn(2)-C6 fungal-type domain-containing protein n=1 Tax=Polychaeton citri CBS 116435 TaxID=1314669 RepID=A0A9P4QAG3_9PEZI|nr:hypothetical protein K431DRAFT_72804 [Polychaeton citri CBS 116435]